MRAVGIDVGKASLDLAAGGGQPGVPRFANSRAGIGKLVRRREAVGAERIVVEATGGYEEPLLEACCVNHRPTKRYDSKTPVERLEELPGVLHLAC